MRMNAMLKRAGLAVVVGMTFTSGAFTRMGNVSGGDFRAAYSVDIDWRPDMGFSYSTEYDASLGGLKTGTFTLSSDLVTGRIVAENSNKTVLDLGEGRTLTVIGNNTGSAIGFTSAASSSSIRLASGTILFPWSYDDGTNTWSYDEASVTTYPYLGLPRGTDNKTLHDATFTVGGGVGEAVLSAKELHLIYGTNNWLVVTNNGRVAVGGSGTKLGSYGTGSFGNGILVTDGGVFSNANAGTSLALSLFGTASGASNAFVVANGGRIDGFEHLVIGTGTCNRVVFTGAATVQEFTVTNGTQTMLLGGKGNRLEVLAGATLRVLTGSNGRGRIWIGNGGNYSSNVLHVAGAGSLFSCASANGNLIGQSQSEGNRVEVEDGAVAAMPAMHIGQGGIASAPARGNVVRVSGGGTLNDPNTMCVGYGDTNPKSNGYSCSNRLEVMSGGTVNVRDFHVGWGSNSWANAVDVSGGSLYVTNVLQFGRWGQMGRFTVRDGGKVSVGGNFNFGQASGVLTSNNVMEVLSGGEVAANQFIVYGTNHTLVVSNGTIRTVAEKSHGIQLPWYNNGRDWDLAVEIAGTNPVLRALGTPSSKYVFAIRRGANVLFRVPRGGYTEAPLQAPDGRLAIVDDSAGHIPALRFDVSACGARPVRCVIAEGNPLEVKAETLADMVAHLPENCRLRVSDNRLILTVNEFGTQILFR